MYDGTRSPTHGRLNDREYRTDRTVTGLVLTTGIAAAVFGVFMLAVAAPGLVVATVLGGAVAEAARAVAARWSAGGSSGQHGTATPG